MPGADVVGGGTGECGSSKWMKVFFTGRLAMSGGVQGGRAEAAGCAYCADKAC
eukprot:CAMPEP_0203952436 /NCGR_PEP_ID=MMETSP0359-20131031/86081_1 /ASSEMBLY_ACC=CAM_ASM_000338 /TAXON_ID=268821 /ORGANISM="Scrippsiella Hangoei, Strain SHTV-5" /LENGTH=52 /DNA_ID=CAMNT_0050885425 /DNA_START=60 /DNA_END=215 /DNA_ORIENTATION=+